VQGEISKSKSTAPSTSIGIVNKQSEGILSGSNNLVIYACDEQEFSEYFGFTKKETTMFLEGSKV
jgi:hypothetical protein